LRSRSNAMSNLFSSLYDQYERDEDIERLSLHEVISRISARVGTGSRSVRDRSGARARLIRMIAADRSMVAADRRISAAGSAVSPVTGGLIAGDMIAGVDEAGRGPLAGPVVAAAVVLPLTNEALLASSLIGIDDSKRLSAASRESLFLAVNRIALAVSVGIATSAEIDRTNILSATHTAMRRAVDGLTVVPDLVLVDGNSDPRLPHPTTCIVKGDAQQLSVSTASVVAKVVRDTIMDSIHLRYHRYGFDSNKGYPTPGHYQALADWGPCPVHRRSFRLSASS
jgi:ribonuclease HII